MIDNDDRISCTTCKLLDHRGICNSSFVSKSIRYKPFAHLLKRCPGYEPNSIQSDQRTAIERWPGIIK